MSCFLVEYFFRPEKEGMARVFAVQIQSFVSITSVAVQVLCVAVERSGFITSYKAVMGAGAKAKTVTNLLILLSVLWLVVIF